MKNKKIFIKFISIILLISLLMGLNAFVLFKPKKANALVGVAVPTAEVPEYLGSATEFREKVLDTIVRAAAKAAVQLMVNNTINWARSGFRGQQPFAIASWENYFKAAIDVGSARFIEEFGLTELCLPFRDILGRRLGLGTLYNYQPSYQVYAACTIGTIVDNVEEFFKNPSISTYGWEAWTALSQPQNNIYGSLLLAAERRTELESEAKEAKEKEATVSGGYKNFTECMKEGTLGICIDEMMKTPGKEIHDAIEDAIGADLEWIISSDEISELLGAFISGIFNRLFSGLYNFYDPYKDLRAELPPGGEYPPSEGEPPLPEIPEPEYPESPEPEVPETPEPLIPKETWEELWPDIPWPWEERIE